MGCAKMDNTAAYLLLGIENQAHIHYAMPVRDMLYDAVQYSNQVEIIAKSHRKERDLNRNITSDKERAIKINSDEFLSGFYKEDHLLPVITLVIYWSADEWDGPKSIHEMLNVKDGRLLKYSKRI